MEDLMAQEQTATERYLEQWLSTAEINPAYHGFEHLPLAENDGGRAGIMHSLARAIFLYHRNPESYQRELARKLKRLRYEDAATAINSLPRSRNLRSGRFGEVLPCEFLRQLRGF